MLDDNDDGARVGLWVTIGIIAFLLFGLIGGLAIRQMHQRAAPPVAAVAGAADATLMTTQQDTFVDGVLQGERVSVVYFGVGQSALDAQAQSALQTAVGAMSVPGSRRALISGFHDTTGGAAQNAELAKARALAVRDWLRGQGVASERLLLRKPETTTGDGSNQEARRVEIWLVD